MANHKFFMITQLQIGMTELQFANIGRANLTNEQAIRYSYQNDIKGLGKYFFNLEGIQEAFKHLVVVNKHPEHFMKPEYKGCRNQLPSFKIPLTSYYNNYISPHLNDIVEVYFNGVHYGIPSHKDKGPWWATLRTLEDRLSKKIPVKPEWWYGPDGKEYSSKEFKLQNKPYQGFLRIFGERGLQIFSCFVNGNITIEGWYSNYNTIKDCEALEHENMGFWKGTLQEFLYSAEIVQNAISDIVWNSKEIGLPHGEIKLVHPELGAISMSSFKEPLKLQDIAGEYEIKFCIPATVVMSKKAVDLLMKEELSDFHLTEGTTITETEAEAKGIL